MSFGTLLSGFASAHETGRPVTAALSTEQQAALDAPFRESAVVCAGAGSGKTRLLVQRVVRMLKRGVPASHIAVVTFTTRAAGEFESRIKAELGPRCALPTMGTAHALARSALARHKVPVTMDQALELELVSHVRAAAPEEYADLTDAEFLQLVNRAREEEASATTPLGQLAYQYEQLLDLEGLTDFSGMLRKAASLPSAAFRFVLVDESQDLSKLQLRFLRARAANAAFWFVGDPDQSIFSFCGAEDDVMQRLMADCQGKVYFLTTNYRCATKIVECATNVVENNANRTPVRWKANRTDTGSVDVRFHETGEDELTWATKWLAEAPLGTRAVLARTNSLIAPLQSLGMPAMSVHAAKGLEWDEVAVLGCEAALFPHPLAGRQEERRLFYVAMTRARNSLVLSYVGTRSKLSPNGAAKDDQRNPSPFLYETQALQARA